MVLGLIQRGLDLLQLVQQRFGGCFDRFRTFLIFRQLPGHCLHLLADFADLLDTAMGLGQLVADGHQVVELRLQILHAGAAARIGFDLEGHRQGVAAYDQAGLVLSGYRQWSFGTAEPQDQAVECLGIGIVHVPHKAVHSRLEGQAGFALLFIRLAGVAFDQLAAGIQYLQGNRSAVRRALEIVVHHHPGGRILSPGAGIAQFRAAQRIGGTRRK